MFRIFLFNTIQINLVELNEKRFIKKIIGAN